MVTLSRRTANGAVAVALFGALGGACTVYGKDPLVVDRGRCPKGLVENTGLPAPFCRPAHTMKAGEPCSSDENCLGSMTCNRGYRNGNCQVERSAKEHEPCEEDRDCVAGLLCNGSATPPIRAGQCHMAGAL